jgi:hypothetical protein
VFYFIHVIGFIILTFLLKWCSFYINIAQKFTYQPRQVKLISNLKIFVWTLLWECGLRVLLKGANWICVNFTARMWTVSFVDRSKLNLCELYFENVDCEFCWQEQLEFVWTLLWECRLSFVDGSKLNLCELYCENVDCEFCWWEQIEFVFAELFLWFTFPLPKLAQLFYILHHPLFVQVHCFCLQVKV